MLGQIISHYRILNKLGEGGMGVVYVAEDILLARRVAIKTLNVEPGKQHYRQRFLREARAVSALHHPNIAIVHDYGETPDGRPYIVMELVQGQTLAELLSHEALPLSRVLEIVEKVTKALAEAHRLGIIHRDIKPSNVAINERGEVKVLDFGLAKNLNAEASDLSNNSEGGYPLLSTQTREGVIIGTPPYLSPEQALGLPVDARSDLFSLGSLFYECVAGRPAFEGTSPIAICAKVVRDEPPPPSQFRGHTSQELDRVIGKLIAKKPEERYQSADELLSDLDALRATSQEMDNPPARRIHHQQKKVRTSLLMTVSNKLRSPRILSLVFLSAFIVALLAVWGLSSKPFFKTRPPMPEAQRWYEKGIEALRNGRYYAASKMLQEAVRVEDGFVLAHARLAEALSELDYTDKSKDEIIRIGQLVPDRSQLQPLDALYLEAITNTVTRDFPKAVEKYSQIEEQVTDKEKAPAFLDLGNAQDKSEDFKAAAQSYQEAIKRDPQYAAAYLRLGVNFGRQQNLSSADAAFNEAQRLYEISGDIEGVAEVFYQRGYQLNKLRKIDEARAQLDQALDRSRATGNKSQQILTLLQLSSVNVGAGDLAQAEQRASEAVELAQANEMENLATRGLIDLGNTFFVKGNYSEAEKYFKQALDFAQRNKGRRNEARALLSLGSLYTNMGSPVEARRYVEQALGFYRQGGYQKETALALAILGHASDQSGDYQEATKAFEEQLQLANQINDQSQAALAHEGLGLVLAHQERYTEALPHFDEKYKIYEALGAKYNQARTLMQRALVLWPLGRYPEALESVNVATAVTGEPEDIRELQARTHLIKAHVALSRLLFQEAASESKQALDLADKNDREIMVEAEYLLGLSQALAGKSKAGREMCEKAVVLAKQTGDPYFLSGALLALAETSLKSGDADNALKTALRAQEVCARFGQPESEWRAWLFAAQASKRIDAWSARNYIARAYNLLIGLKEKWGEEAYHSYHSRPDVEYYSGLLQKF
jgi:serine/threonine protein kinase/Flp pilus assembly protein TadD